jgi:hypothetical protein
MITKRCAKYRARLVKKFKNVTGVGIFNCRKVAGSDSYSQHAWGNAADIFGPQFVRAAIVKWSLGRWVRKHYHIHMIIHQETYWEYPSFLPRHYNGIPHSTHVHVDFLPYHEGIPPCATARFDDEGQETITDASD